MREIRPYGSARGVRRNPYPYRDSLTPRAQHGQILTLPDPTPAQPSAPAHRGAMATLPDSQSAAGSGSETAAIRIAIRARIGGSLPQQSRTHRTAPSAERIGGQSTLAESHTRCEDASASDRRGVPRQWI